MTARPPGSSTGIPDPATKAANAPLLWNGSAWVAGSLLDTVNLKDDAVTAAKIAAGAVGNSELAASAVTDAKVSASAGIALSKLAQGGAAVGQAVVWNGSAWAPGTVSGGGGGSGIDPTILNAKGDLVGASANDTPARVPAASGNGMILMSDATQTPGVIWASPTPAPLVIGISPQATNYTPANNTSTSTTPLLISGLLSFADLSAYTELRWTLAVTATFGTGTKVRPQFSTDGGVNWQYFEASGSAFEQDGTSIDSTSGVTAVLRKSAWGAIAANAKAEVDLRLSLYGTTAAAAGTIRGVYFQFR